MQVSRGLYVQNKERQRGVLLKTFKMKAVKVNSKYNYISNTTLKKLCHKSRKSLRELAIRGATCLTADGIVESIGELFNLQKLDLSYSKMVNDDVIEQILKTNGDQLQSIALRCLPEITKRTIMALHKYAPNLQQLDVSGCRGIELDSFFALRDFPCLTDLLIDFLEPTHSHMAYIADCARIQKLSTFRKYRLGA